MTKRTIDFFSSFGVMLVGLGALFGGSVLVRVPPQGGARQFPLSGPRTVRLGGDTNAVPAALPVSRPLAPVVKKAAAFTPELSAAAALVVDDKTNTVLFERQSNAARPLASITKLMSALVLSDIGLVWSATTTVVRGDIDASSHQLAAGDVVTLEELWNVALVGSSNSAVMALVRASGLTLEDFVARMNAKAESLHLPTTVFVEPTGLDARNVASAWDTARILKEALKDPHIARALATPEYYVHPVGDGKARRVWSTDWLLTSWVPNRFNKDEIAGKTGFIPESGYNFAVRLSTGGHSVRVVVLGTASDTARFGEARDLAEWAFSSYTWPDESEYTTLVE